MVDLLGKMKQLDKMMELVNEMCEEGLTTLETVAKVMRRLAGAGKWEDAIKIFDNLGTMELEKNTEAMNILLDTLCKEKHVVAAREVFLELKTHIPPNANTFNTFVHGWCKANRIDEAEWTILEMKGFGFRPSVITYTTILEAHCKHSNFHKVYKLLDEMHVEDCSPNVVTYTIVMHALAKSEEYDAAFQIVDRMKVKATTVVGANILKDDSDPKILPDSEYPDWLWHLLDKHPPFIKLDNRARIKENNS